MRKLFSVLSFVLLFAAVTYGQAAIDIPISGSDGSATIQMAVGLDLTATDCLDPALGEADLPPIPPAGVFDIRFDLAPYGCSGLNGVLYDYRAPGDPPAFPFTGSVQHTMKWQLSSTGLPIDIAYDLPAGAEMSITDQIGGSFLNIGPFSGMGTATIPASYTGIFSSAYVVMDYTNIGSGPTPVFEIAPASLDFGSVILGDNSTLQATVTNTGDADLIISDVLSSDAQFTFSPDVFPITIVAGGNQIFDVTFAPTAIGLQSATLTFTHNASGSPTSYNIQGTGVAGPTPSFDISPASLDFGNIVVGSNSTLQATVSNSGTADLIISDLTSSDGQFTYSPAAPITIAAGDNQVFDITFTPSAVGSQSGTLTFTHNAAGSPTDYSVQGVGLDPGPIFNVSPTSLNFGTVDVGNTSDLIVTVTNTGATNPLTISSAAIAEAGFTVLPTSATINAGDNQVFTVTFAPTVNGSYTGTLVFTHDAPGSPNNVDLSGTGYEPPAVYGLVFDEDTAFVPENTYDITATLQLLGLPAGDAVHALQFKLQSNMVTDDETILTFQSITKSGSIASNPDWVLETNVVRGPIQPNGASEDVIYCLLYNIGNGTLTGDWTNLMKVTYKTAVLPPLTQSQKSSFNLIDVEGSTIGGNNVDITPSDPTLEVIVEAAGGTYGDINGDGCVDILDLIMVVDHIVGRDSLTGTEFDRADLAPWPNGTSEPSPDGYVNVQDLSVIQWIILNMEYPNGDPVTPCGYLAKINGPTDATVTLYINSEGISAYIDADIGIRGAQIEFNNISDNTDNLVINTTLGQGYYNLVDGLFCTLMYDRSGQKSIDAGVNNFMADMPFSITNPQEVTIAKIVLVDVNVKKLSNIQVQTVYGTPALPLDYVLFQNYPNPFNPTTAIKFQVPKTSNVKVSIYNMLGQEVKTLFADHVVRGTYTVNWDGTNNSGTKVSSGTYIYRMTAGDFVQSKKMVLLK